MRILSLMLALLWASAAFAEPPADSRAKLNTTLETLAKTKQTDAALREKQAKTKAELLQLQSHATALAERLQVSERRVNNEERALADANNKLSTKQKEFEARKADYAMTLTTLLRIRELPVTAMFSEPDHIRELMQTATVLEKTNLAAAQKARRLATDLQDLKQLKNDASERRSRTQAETQALNAEQQQLEKAVKARQALQAQLEADHAQTEEKIALLSRQSENLQALLGKLDAQARAQQAKTKQPPKNISVKPLSGGKGSLRAPVSGEVLHRYGERKSNNETYRGMVYRARAGSSVVAPYDGEVVFNGPFRDYGTMVLIKHQNGYISLIAGVGKVMARLNQTVIKGEPIAQMPDDKAGEAYVELRDSNAKPIDPGDWFANVTRTAAN